MIVLVNPRATRPKNRRFPLPLMALGAALPDGVSWEIVDGNRPGLDPFREISARVDARAGGPDPVRLLAAPRWKSGRYEDPRLLRLVRKWARVPDEDRQAYGHLRTA
jgi:hypothetical protein